MLSRIIELLVEPGADQDEFVYSYENAISSLGKLVYYHYDGFTVTVNTVQMFLEHLPLQVDSEEARPVNKLFFQMILGRNQAIMLHPKIVRETVAEIQKYHENNPDLETLDEEGEALLQKVLKEKY